MATALTLVNRVRRQLRWGDTSAFDDDQSKVVLDRVNDATAAILSMWDWECDFRTGTFNTLAMADTTNATVDTGSLIVTNATASLYNKLLAGSDSRGAASMLMVVQNDSAYLPSLQTAFGVIFGYTTAGSVSTLYLDNYFTGTTSVAATVRTLACEYSLPSTVREVLSVRNQNENNYLRDVSSESWVSDFTRRAHLTVSDRSICYAARRFAAPTVAAGTGLSSVPTVIYSPTTSVVIYPTPSTSYRIDYSYLISRAEMTATTDTLSGVPRSIEDLVVSLAFARCTQDAVGDANASDGLALEQRVLERGEVLSRQIGLRRDLTPGDRAAMQQPQERGR